MELPPPPFHSRQVGEHRKLVETWAFEEKKHGKCSELKVELANMDTAGDELADMKLISFNQETKRHELKFNAFNWMTRGSELKLISFNWATKGHELKCGVID